MKEGAPLLPIKVPVKCASHYGLGMVGRNLFGKIGESIGSEKRLFGKMSDVGRRTEERHDTTFWWIAMCNNKSKWIVYYKGFASQKSIA